MENLRRIKPKLESKYKRHKEDSDSLSELPGTPLLHPFTLPSLRKYLKFQGNAIT
jgi:hypothetical protein